MRESMMLLVHILSLRISPMHFQSGSMLILAPLGKYVMSLGSHHSQTKRDIENVCVCLCVIRFDIFTHFNLNGYGYRA